MSTVAAPERVLASLDGGACSAASARACVLRRLGCGTYLYHRFRPVIDFYFSRLLKGMGAITAPRLRFQVEDWKLSHHEPAG